MPLPAQPLLVHLLSQSYAVSDQFYDSFTGQSNSYSFTGHNYIAGSVGYTSYYEGIPRQNLWSSAAGPCCISVLGDAGITADGYNPYGSMFAHGIWNFSLPNEGTNQLTVNFSVDNVYLDNVDFNAIAVSLKQNGNLYDQESFSVYPQGGDQSTPSSCQISLNNTPSDIWELSVQINEAAWNGDYVRVVATPDIQAIPEPRALRFFEIACILFFWDWRMKAKHGTNKIINSPDLIY